MSAPGCRRARCADARRRRSLRKRTRRGSRRPRGWARCAPRCSSCRSSTAPRSRATSARRVPTALPARRLRRPLRWVAAWGPAVGTRGADIRDRDGAMMHGSHPAECVGLQNPSGLHPGRKVPHRTICLPCKHVHGDAARPAAGPGARHDREEAERGGGRLRGRAEQRARQRRRRARSRSRPGARAPACGASSGAAARRPRAVRRASQSAALHGACCVSWHRGRSLVLF